MSYYNTTKETGKDLKKSVAKAQSQNDKILAFFKFRPQSMYTPFEVCQYVFHDSVPITSVRRSMSNLTDKGLLRKTSTQKIGQWGKFNYTWRLK